MQVQGPNSGATVRIAPDDAVAGDRAAEDVVSAALSIASVADLAALVGRWVVAHSGFVLQILADDDAQARLALFVAMDGSVGALV